MSGELSPEDDSSVLSRMGYCWLTSLLQVGASTVLRPSLIYRLDARHQPDVERAEAELGQRGLALVLVRLFRREWLLTVCWRLVQIGLQSCIPFVLRAFVAHLTAGSADGHYDGVLLAFLLGLLPVVDMICGERAIWLNTWTSARVRACLVLLIGRKVLRRRHDDGSGVDVASLVAADVDRIQESVENLHFLWRTPLVLVVVLLTVARLLGWLPAAAALASLVVVLAATAAANRKFAALRQAASQQTDRRVSLSTELVKELENVKTLALERLFVERILAARRDEVALLTRYRVYFSLVKSLSLLLAPLVLLSALLTHALRNGVDSLAPDVVFATLVAVNTLRLPFQNIVDVSVSLVDTSVALGRIEALLAAREAHRHPTPHQSHILIDLRRASFSVDPPKSQNHSFNHSTLNSNDNSLNSNDHSFDHSLNSNDHSFDFNDHSFDLNDHSLNSNDNTFESNDHSLNSNDNTFDLNGDSLNNSLYSNDDSFDLNDDSLNNDDKSKLLEPLDESVVLLHDIWLTLHSGELIWVCGRVGAGKSSLLLGLLGELTLCGGSARVCHSTLYCPQTPALLSGSIVDNVCWGLPLDGELFGRVAAGCCLLADFRQLVNGANTLVGEAGVNLSGGQKARIGLARAAYAALSQPSVEHLLLLDDPLAAVDNHTGEALLRFLRGLPGNCAVCLVSHHSQLIAANERAVVLDRGRVVAQGPLCELLAKHTDDSVRQLLADVDNAPACQSAVHDSTCNDEKSTVTVAQNVLAIHRAEQRSEGRVALDVYVGFFSTAPWRWACVALIFLLGFGTQVWLQLTIAQLASGGASLARYGGLVAANSALVVAKMLLLFVQAIASCSSLHMVLLLAIARLTKSALDTTPSGHFITRFSDDLNTIDNKLALALDVFVRLSLDLLQIVVLGAVATRGLFAGVAAVVAAAAFALGRWYGRSSIELARSLAIVRSPVQTRIVEMARAGSCIRAYQQLPRWAGLVRDEVWTWISVAVVAAGANRWLNTRLNLIAGVGVWSLAYLSLYLAASVPVAYVALGLAYALELRLTLNVLIQSTVQVENAMQSCERIREFATALDQEPLGGDALAAAGRGAVHVAGLGVTYRPGLPPSLVDVSFDVAPGERLGLCGRTGSGKSSVVRALLRLVDYTGVVTVDGQDVRRLDLAQLRSALATVTQSSADWRGTVASLVDPAAALDRHQLRRVLAAVGLRLDPDAAAASLSAGQLQLCAFCRALARVMFLGARILILDEASSAVDRATEQRMLDLLDQPPLRHCTVIVVAHRTAVQMACSRLIVLDAGRVVESGTPKQLNQPGTHFFDLIHSQSK